MSFNPVEEQFHESILARGHAFEVVFQVDLLILDEGILMRVKIDQDKVAEYRDLWLQGVKFPPMDVFADIGGDNKNRVADGFHRLLGAIEAGLKTIRCRVFRGDRRAAILYACKINTIHGWRSTALDRRKAVITLLLDNEWKKESNYWIAEQCGVDEGTVRNINAELKADLLNQTPQTGIYIYGNSVDGTKSTNKINAGEKPTPEPEVKIVKRGGKEFPMRVNNIGVKQKDPANESARDTRPTTTALQKSATLAANTSAQQENEDLTEQQSPKTVSCRECGDECNEKDCTKLEGRWFFCGSCDKRLSCDACNEFCSLETVTVFGEFMYCASCAVAAERLQKPLLPKQEQSFDPNTLPILAPSQQVASRLQETPFKQLAEASDKAETKRQPTIQPSGHEDWCTSPEHVQLIRQFAGGPIALDPCSNPYATTAPLLKFYKEHNGLSKDWAKELESRHLRGLVYVNPPYDSETLEKVASHCVTQYNKGLEILSLVPCKTDQDWWQDAVLKTASTFCFVKGRIKFWENGGPKGGAPMSCAFIYWGVRVEQFYKIFAAIGGVIELGMLREAKQQKDDTLKLVKGGEQ
jgi:hypothetical protein